MKSIQNAKLAYSAGKFVLALGTIIVLFNVASSLVPTWPPLAQAFIGILIVAILLPLLDGAWDYIEDALRSLNGQERPMPKGLLTTYFVLGGLGVAGSMFLSIISASMISDVVVDDRSEVAEKIGTAQAQGDAAYLKLVSAAERSVQRAELALQQAQAAESQAEKKAVAAIGGDFAKQWDAGNAWVRTAPETARNRSKVEKARKAAATNTAQAQTALASAQAAYNDVMTNGRTQAQAGTQAVVAAHNVVLSKWIQDLKTTTGFFVRVDIAAGVLSMWILFLLFKAKEIPDDRTLMEVFTKAVRLASDATVYALGIGVDAAENSMKGAGIVAHPLPGQTAPLPVITLSPAFVPPHSGGQMPQFVPPVNLPLSPAVCPPVRSGTKKASTGDRARITQLRDKIKKYTARAKSGKLTDKGRVGLAAAEKELAAIRRKLQSK
jgi:hypothetical protein